MKRLTAILMIFLLLTFSGCSGQKPGNESPNNDSAVIFTDALGREITLDTCPERTAALIGSFADVWILAGGTVCASAEDAWDDFGLDLGNAVNIGGAHSPSLEALLSANPDFVIASASTAANVEMKEALENAGITVAYFDVDCFEDYLAMLDICTDITGRKDLYKQYGTSIEAEIAGIRDECVNSDLPDEKRTVLLIRTSASSVKAKGSEGTVLGEMLSDLGCINIADNDTSILENLSVESVIRQNPYRIFVVTMGDDTEKAMENLTRLIKENPAWSSLDAVKENRLHVMDRKMFNIKPNAKWADSYAELSKILLEKDM